MGFWQFAYGFIPDVWFKGMNLRSYTGIMLVDSIRIRRRDRKLRKALNRLKTKYTPDVIANLYRKYSSTNKLSPAKESRNIRKFQSKLAKFVESFIYDYQVFRAYYLDVLQLISQSLLSDKRESKGKFTDIETLFAELETKRNELVFPYREIQVFKGQLGSLLRDLMKDIRMDERSDIMVGRGSYPASISFFSFLSPARWWSRRKIIRREKKAIKRLGKDLAFYDQIYARINQELQAGVRQDFLFLLIEFFKRVDVADKRLEEIKQDLEIILKRLWDDVESVKKSLNNILTLLKNEPQIKDNPQFGKMEQDISQLEKTFQELIKQDFKNTEALRIMLQEVLREGNVIMAEMEEQSMKIAA